MRGAARQHRPRARIAEVLNDNRTLIGLSDAGAHVDMFAEAGYTTYLLGHWVREKQAPDNGSGDSTRDTSTPRIISASRIAAA